MTRRHVLWAVIVLTMGAAAALLLPASPYYFPMLLAARPQYQGQPLSHWLGRLEEGASDDRQQAIYAVGVIGMPAEAAVPVLARIMVEDGEPRLRNEAAFALSKMAPACKAAVPELARALRDDVPLVRMNAARALYCLGSDGQSAAPALLECLNDPENQTNLDVFTFTVQHQIALALGRVSAGTTEAVPALREALQAADTDHLRLTMIRALGEVGRPAQPAADEVRRFADARDPDLRFTVAEALARIEGTRPQAPAPRPAPKAPKDE
jgi:HEAT repeat protein